MLPELMTLGIPGGHCGSWGSLGESLLGPLGVPGTSPWEVRADPWGVPGGGGTGDPWGGPGHLAAESWGPWLGMAPWVQVQVGNWTLLPIFFGFMIYKLI